MDPCCGFEAGCTSTRKACGAGWMRVWRVPRGALDDESDAGGGGTANQNSEGLLVTSCPLDIARINALDVVAAGRPGAYTVAVVGHGMQVVDVEVGDDDDDDDDDREFIRDREGHKVFL